MNSQMNSQMNNQMNNKSTQIAWGDGDAADASLTERVFETREADGFHLRAAHAEADDHDQTDHGNDDQPDVDGWNAWFHACPQAICVDLLFI